MSPVCIVPAVSRIHHLHVHEYDDHLALTFHVTLPDTMDLIQAHDIASLIEQTIREKMNIKTMLHLEPLDGM